MALQDIQMKQTYMYTGYSAFFFEEVSILKN